MTIRWRGRPFASGRRAAIGSRMMVHLHRQTREHLMQGATGQAFLDDGVVLVKGVLSEEQLARCRAAFDWAVENHGPNAFRIFDGTEQQSHNDNANPLAKARLDELVASLPFGKLFADLWGSKHVWYFAEEVFLKTGGRGSRPPRHQETPRLPRGGAHRGQAWGTFQSLRQ